MASVLCPYPNLRADVLTVRQEERADQRNEISLQERFDRIFCVQTSLAELATSTLHHTETNLLA